MAGGVSVNLSLEHMKLAVIRGTSTLPTMKLPQCMYPVNIRIIIRLTDKLVHWRRALPIWRPLEICPC